MSIIFFFSTVHTSLLSVLCSNNIVETKVPLSFNVYIYFFYEDFLKHFCWRWIAYHIHRGQLYASEAEFWCRTPNHLMQCSSAMNVYVEAATFMLTPYYLPDTSHICLFHPTRQQWRFRQWDPGGRGLWWYGGLWQTREDTDEERDNVSRYLQCEHVTP